MSLKISLVMIFLKCVKEIYECFTVNNNNFTSFKEFIHCPSPLGGVLYSARDTEGKKNYLS